MVDNLKNPLKNYTRLGLNKKIINKMDLAHSEIVFCFFILSNLHYLKKTDYNTDELEVEKIWPQKRLDKFFTKDESLQTFTSLLLADDLYLVKSTLIFINNIYNDKNLLLSFIKNKSSILKLYYSCHNETSSEITKMTQKILKLCKEKNSFQDDESFKKSKKFIYKIFPDYVRYYLLKNVS